MKSLADEASGSDDPRLDAFFLRERADAQKKTLHAAEQQRPDIAAVREIWRRSSWTGP